MFRANFCRQLMISFRWRNKSWNIDLPPIMQYSHDPVCIVGNVPAVFKYNLLLSISNIFKIENIRDNIMKLVYWQFSKKNLAKPSAAWKPKPNSLLVTESRQIVCTRARYNMESFFLWGTAGTSASAQSFSISWIIFAWPLNLTQVVPRLYLSHVRDEFLELLNRVLWHLLFDVINSRILEVPRRFWQYTRASIRALSTVDHSGGRGEKRSEGGSLLMRSAIMTRSRRVMIEICVTLRVVYFWTKIRLKKQFETN